ncbi:hypothetical protein EYF80_007304 [Liparis tanakae]|uniref:Uncharacterized protein n=1 Tax=Liparis tanakae TaxID=230148 RepID=A0A4Z2IWV2_9TELE|nr:hypothetical protein EYF80_007304 [Liparis tanakae]
MACCGRPVDDEVMEMLGGHGHCDAGWLLLWNCHLPKSTPRQPPFANPTASPASCPTPRNSYCFFLSNLPITYLQSKILSVLVAFSAN